MNVHVKVSFSKYNQMTLISRSPNLIIWVGSFETIKNSQRNVSIEFWRFVSNWNLVIIRHVMIICLTKLVKLLGKYGNK